MIGEKKVTKLCSLILALCLIFSLSACNKDNSAQDTDNSGFCVECGEEISLTDKFCSFCGTSINKTNTTGNDTTQNHNGDLDSADVPSSTINTPNTTTKPNTPTHTHSYSGATCTTPAKCSCGATSGSALGHSYSNGKCTRCSFTDINYVKTYNANETWIVDGQWEITVHSAKKHYMCNEYSDHNGMAECVIITYSYKNLGYSGTFQDLYISSMSFDAYDAEGEATETYPCTHTTNAKVCSIGTKCSNAQQAFALYNNSSQLTLIFEHYTSNGLGKQKAKFVIPIS